MKLIRLVATGLLFALAVLAQPKPDDVWARAKSTLEWTFAVDLAPCNATPAAAVCRLDAAPATEAAWRSALTNPSPVVVVPAAGADLALAARIAESLKITVAIDASTGPLAAPEAALKAVQPHGARIKVWASPAAWERSGVKTLAAIYMLRANLAGAFLEPGMISDEFLKEAYRLEMKPLAWAMPARDLQRTVATVDALVAYHQAYASRTQGVRRLGGITPEERTQLQSVIPATAPAKPKKARKLLVFDLNVGRFGHPSIPYANLAMQLIGAKTGAWEATVSSDPAVLHPASLRQYDAVYLNNTIGDIFSTAEVRDAFASYIANGGGLIGNHATTVTATDWKEFGNILGARGASHRMTDERVIVNVEDPAHPVTKAFGTGPFEYADEYFRFQAPWSRDKVRVLLSIDSRKTDMNQGRCYGQCYRDDNDYAVAWIQQYGKGRVFYTTLGHNPHVFQNKAMLEFFTAGIQYALGDLEADATPKPVPRAAAHDGILRDLAAWDRGRDQGPVRRLERALDLPEAKLIAFLGQSGVSVAAKEIVCRQLAEIGTAAAVPALSELLHKAETADMARYALERIDAPSAAGALREALSTAPNVKVQTGIIHSLARRRDARLVGALSNLLDTSDPRAALAARNGLGMIATPEAERALNTVRLTPETADALLTLAEQAPADRAVPIYRKLLASTGATDVRVAALHGLARRAASADATPALVTALADPSFDIQAAAVAELARVAPAALVAQYPRLTAPAVRVEALHQLAAITDSAARPLVLEGARAADHKVRVAALECLADLGTAADVPLLLQAAIKPEPDASAAHYALTRLRGTAVDDAIVRELPSSAVAAKLELIRLAGERGLASAAPALLTEASSADAKVRRQSIKALREVAAPEHAAALVALLAKAADDDRADLEAAVAASIRRSATPSVQPLLAAWTSATDDDHRQSLINALAGVGHADGLPVLRSNLSSANADLRRAAVKGLAEWPSTDPMDDLLRVAQSAPAGSPIQVLALRGYVRQVQVPAGRTPAETAKLLGIAMKAAHRADEKKVVLAALQRTPAAESLEIAKAAESDPEVATEAKVAVAALQRALATRRN